MDGRVMYGIIYHSLAHANQLPLPRL